MERWSVVLMLLVLCGCADSSTPAGSQGKATEGKTSAGEELFENVTAHLGVEFQHQAGTNYFMPDQIGSGIALFDCDRDGLLDIYLLQNQDRSNGARHQLFRQKVEGIFENISEGSGLDKAGRGMGVIAGDLNNDGLPDLVVTEYGGTRIFQNGGGAKFEEVTSRSGVENTRWAAPGSFIDFDRDGLLDLVVGNYVDYDPTQVCHDSQGRQEFCAPHAFPPTATRLWRNITSTKGATPKFEDWSVRSGIFKHPGVALGLVCADFTGDGWSDIFCSDDGRANRLFVNQKDGTFTEEAARRGLAFNAMGSTAANMGVALADFNGDALGDLFVTHLTEEFHSLFRQDKPGLFMDVIAASGLQEQAWRGTGFGTVAADFDLDGQLDIALVSGLVRRASVEHAELLPGVGPWWGRYAQRPQLFLKRGEKFKDVWLENPVFCGKAAVGRSLAVGDINNDGRPDLVVGNVGGPAQVYRNIAKSGGHWLKLRVVYPQWGGRDAIGAEVRLHGRGRIWWSVLQPATSYLVSNDPALHFGLGATAQLESAEVLWPDGSKEVFEVGAVDRLLILKRGSGQAIQ